MGNEGKAYAVDREPDFLDFIKKMSREKNLDNIVTILATENILDLPKENLDFIFMRNVTHHLHNRVKYFENLKKFLKPDGRVIIIEHKPSSGCLGHYVSKELIMQEMKEAGYMLEEELKELHYEEWNCHIIALKQ